MYVSPDEDPVGPHPPQRYERRPEPQGCLTAALRVPVQIVMFVLVLPVRLLWDGLVLVATAAGRALAWFGRTVVEPVLRAFGAALGWVLKALFCWPWAALWKHVLAAPLSWLWRYLVAVPATALYRWVLTPLGHALAAVARGVGRFFGWAGYWLLAVPAIALYRWVLTPLGRGLALVARETGAALVVAWHAAGRITLPVLRFLGRALRALFVTPFVWAWTWLVLPVARPVGKALRAVGRVLRAGLSAVGESVRATRAEIRRVLSGTPRTRERERLPEGRRVP